MRVFQVRGCEAKAELIMYTTPPAIPTCQISAHAVLQVEVSYKIWYQTPE